MKFITCVLINNNSYITLSFISITPIYTYCGVYINNKAEPSPKTAAHHRANFTDKKVTLRSDFQQPVLPAAHARS